MKRYYFINYKNKNILTLNFSDLSKKDIFKLLNESRLFISKQPKSSVLSLINITNLKYDIDTLYAFKEYITDTETYVLASAIWGASFFEGMAIEKFAKSVSIPIKICKNELESRNWLVNVK